MHIQYNFDEIVNREGTNCEKYDSRKEIFGKQDIIPLWVADADFKVPDFIVSAVQKRAAHEVYGYPVKTNSYYESIISWLKRRHDWEIKKEWIMYSPNVVVGLASSILALTEKGDKIIVQPPVYFPFYHVVESNDRELVRNPLKRKGDRYYFDLDDLKSKIDDKTKMILLSNPHNPGGMVWTREELEELAVICLEHNIIIVSDEIHADLTLPGFVHTPLASISEEIAEQTITAMAASKTFNVAGLSSAFLVTQNRKFRARYQKLMRGTHISSGNFFGLVATEAAFTNGEEWLNQLQLYLQKNYDYIGNYISEKLPKVTLVKPEATFLIWMDFSEYGLTDKELANKLIDAGVGLSPGIMFGDEGKGYMRLNMGCPLSVLKQAMEKIGEAFIK